MPENTRRLSEEERMEIMVQQALTGNETEVARRTGHNAKTVARIARTQAQEIEMLRSRLAECIESEFLQELLGLFGEILTYNRRRLKESNESQEPYKRLTTRQVSKMQGDFMHLIEVTGGGKSKSSKSQSFREMMDDEK